VSLEPEVVLRDKRASAARWAEVNPTLLEGQRGYERPTGFFKIGDGVTPWNDLPYFRPSDGDAPPEDLLAHVNDETPHPAYDSGPSLALLYENAKV
jgi:hypothetical protein